MDAPRGWTLVALVAALCFLAGSAGWFLAQDRHPGAGSLDVGFLRDMRTHHESAIVLSQVELAEGRLDGIRTFADEILRFQSYELGLMDRIQLDWGHRPEERPDLAMGWMGEPMPWTEMPGMPSDPELALLESGGNETDAVFAALMIDHHAGGVAMAAHAAREAADADVRELAARMASVQQAEIAEMAAAAKRAGLDPAPPGVTFEAYDPESGELREHAH